MSDSGPLLSEQAAFAKHLFIQGYPLWTPDPILLPQSQQNEGLKIGDVGTVDEKGRFDVFFNILEPPQGCAGSSTTLNFPPIEPDHVRSLTDDIQIREVISSPETHWDVDQLDILTDQPGITRRTTQYSATLSNDGAHIILPQGAQSFDLGLQHRRLFEKHARVHGAEWLEQYKDRLGWPRSNSLYLLTGFHRTCSWSIASFGMQTAANTNPVHVYCTTVEVEERIIRDESVWQPSGRFKRKIGPVPDRQGHDNQTVFIRGITITPNFRKQGQTRQQQTGLFEILSSPTQLLNTLMGDSSKTVATGSDTSDVMIQHIPHISQESLVVRLRVEHGLMTFVHQVSHASEVINQYLLSKEPSAKIAVTHDSQWIAILRKLETGQSWTLGDLESHLETLVTEHYSISLYNDTVYLKEEEDLDDEEELYLLGDPENDIISEDDSDVSDSFVSVQDVPNLGILRSDSTGAILITATGSNPHADRTRSEKGLLRTSEAAKDRSGIKQVDRTPDAVNKVIRHPEYYFTDGSISFLAGNTLFRVHRSFFERESEIFRDLFANAAEYDSPSSFELRPFTLHDVTADEFAQLLWVWYNKEYSYQQQSKENWLSILRLAARWKFEKVRQLAFRQLDALNLPPAERISIYTAHGIDDERLVSSFMELCKSPRLLTPADARLLGMESVLKLVQAREECQCKAIELGHKSPTSASLDEEDLREIVWRFFGKGLDSRPGRSLMGSEDQAPDPNSGKLTRKTIEYTPVVTLKTPLVPDRKVKSASALLAHPTDNKTNKGRGEQEQGVGDKNDCQGVKETQDKEKGERVTSENVNPAKGNEPEGKQDRRNEVKEEEQHTLEVQKRGKSSKKVRGN